jgi:hypothetical protein
MRVVNRWDVWERSLGDQARGRFSPTPLKKV